MKKLIAVLLTVLLALGLCSCSSPESWQEHYEAGIRCLSEQDAEKAADAFEKAIETDPSHAEVYQELAALYLAQNHPEQAAAWLQKGIDATGDIALKEMLAGLAAPEQPQAESAAESTPEAQPAPASPDTAPALPEGVLAVDEDLEGFSSYNPYADSPIAFSENNYVAVDENIMSALASLIEAGIAQDKDKVWEYAALPETWMPLVGAAHAALGDPGDNECYWTSWNGAVIRFTTHTSDFLRGKDIYDVVCIDYREQNGAAFRAGFMKGQDTGEYTQDYSYGTTTEWVRNEPMRFSFASVVPAFPDFNSSGDDLDHPLVFM